MALSQIVDVASTMVKVPERVSLNGKAMGWSTLLHGMGGDALAGYLAESLSYALFDESKVAFMLKVNPQTITGLSMVDDVRVSANDVLLLAGAMEQLSSPALRSPSYDYADLFLSFRDILLGTHEQGDKVDVNHPVLISHMHSGLQINRGYESPQMTNRFNRGM